MKIRFFAMALVGAALLAGCGGKADKGINLADRPISEWKTVLKEDGNPADIFKQKDGVIWMRGDFGYIRTTETYDNGFELSVEWRWIGEATNSGIFINVYEDGIWPSGYEIQLWADHAGDIINSGNATSNEHKANIAAEAVKPHVVWKREPSNEKPVGEWNKADIRCEGDVIYVHINGEYQNMVTGISSRGGYIGLQSEGKEIEFRNVIVKPLP